MTRAQIAALFGTSTENIRQHLKNIYAEGEIATDATSKKFLGVQDEGGRSVRRQTTHYSLDAILAVGYRVRSDRGVQFRQWASTVLREYLIKGFAMNDERLKDPAGLDYFDELLERIRDIRASEKRFYQKIKDVFTTAVDYEPSDPLAKQFFATVQNKVVYAVTGRTAAELILARADPAQPNMGLTTWRGGVVRKGDVTIAKNYLTHEEVSSLNRLTTMLLDYAEDRARGREQMTMANWAERVDKFLEFNERQVLPNAGSVSRKSMETQVHRRYGEFDEARKAQEVEVAEREHMAELEQIAEVAKRPNAR
ncbi:virulence RhuM family protein [Kocuria varians]